MAKSNHGIWKIFRHKERDSIARLLNAKAHSSLLDLGSGAGYYAIYFKEEYNLDVFCVDSSPAMIDQLNKRGIPSRQVSIEDLDQFQLFDNALAAGVLEFVKSPEKFFKSIFNIITPGGRLVILIPTHGSFGWLYRVVHALGGCKVFIRKSKEYEELASQYGFIKIRSEKPTLISRAICFEKFNEENER